jgi:hypothetical protein
MPKVAQEVRTVMYSLVGKDVVVHKFPFNANDPLGRAERKAYQKAKAAVNA